MSEKNIINQYEEKLFQDMNLALQSIAQKNSDDRNKDLPLIYIVGAPRSGTTILSQVLSYSLDVGYINNLIARFWNKPSIGIALSNKFLEQNGRDSISFSSRHGTTSTIGDPHEFGNFWTKIFKLNDCETHHLTDEQLNNLNDIENKYLLENELLGCFGKPVLFKNIICGFHAEYLTKLHSKSLFIFIERDNIDTISSILKVRKERLDNEKMWWSLKPKSFKEVLSDYPVLEVSKQVVLSKREFIEELTKPTVNMYYLRYEEFIKNPNFFIEDITKKIEELFYNKINFRHIGDNLLHSSKTKINQKNDTISKSINIIKGNKSYEYNKNNI